MKKTAILVLLPVYLCKAQGSDPIGTSTSTVRYKGYASLGFNYNLAGKAEYVYGKYNTFNSESFSLSNGILVKDQLYIGVRTDIERLNETIFYPVALELGAKLGESKRNILYVNTAAGYGFGSTEDRIVALNWFNSSKLVFHLDVGFIYERKLWDKLGLIVKLYYHLQYFKSFEYSGLSPQAVKTDYYFTFRNVGLSLGICF